MLAGNEIKVPDYQRAYSWDTPQPGVKSRKRTHTDVFLKDLEEHYNTASESQTTYYLGHFLFEKNGDTFYIIDGQQRLTTVTIFLSALFERLDEIKCFSTENSEDYILRKDTICFSTVQYDNIFFKDYVIHKSRLDTDGLETESARRIAQAFDYFRSELKDKSKEQLIGLLRIVSEATCTTHTVANETEAIQMFIFQNNRGKRPSNLEVIKAQFMYAVRLRANGDSDAKIQNIRQRFEDIYKAISHIEGYISEDDVLLYTFRVYVNSLWEDNPVGKVMAELKKDSALIFVENFTLALHQSFGRLKNFFSVEEKRSIAAHSLITLGNYATAIPFVIKAGLFNLAQDKKDQLYKSLEDLALRHSIIGTRGKITRRINDEFQGFSNEHIDITPILDQIERLKVSKEYWLSHWNNTALENALKGNVHIPAARFILWKYENHLISQGKGYAPKRFDDIQKPELEHIAPKTEPKEPRHGYGRYTERFKNEYLNNLGNYLLVSKSHNCQVGNVPFSKKHETYVHLRQQQEIRDMVPDAKRWSKNEIGQRQKKLSDFVLQNF
ncbi:hypothetical protein FUAX_54720 (plasmid) [Fulvitalea axinellae]|uniref:DUF262 domain-containing protein n=2 Tax=Fulvitalea axinellae TaxID=1182444 RepID=A0AAU9CVH1_9BACT|nr:hypothetical protein FUAX_54720 [Fulvitalea axinellae]